MSFFSGFFGPGIDELAAQARETPGSIMIDVRTPDEYRDGHIEGAVSIPLVSIPATAARRLPDKDAPIYAYCLSGARSSQACRELERQGYTNVVNMGGRRPLVRRPGPLARGASPGAPRRPPGANTLLRPRMGGAPIRSPITMTRKDRAMKVVIVGGVAGGATAAARLRRLDENAQIVMIERSDYVSYANCGLPYYIGGTITDRAKLTLQTPQSFRNRFDIDARVRQEVISIDRRARTVTVRRLDDGVEYIESYDKLILSPGARPSIPPLPGVDAERLFTLRTVEDTYRIAEFIEREQPRRATVVGAGFIGLEMAENLRERGLEVTVVQRGGHVMPIFDSDMASLLHNHLREHGVELLLEADVTGFQETAGSISTSLADGRVLKSDLVMLSIGVAPESALAREAGLELGLHGSIKVDAHMRTSDPDIYAVGDAVEVTNVVSDSPALIALAGPANKQGRIAADNICGRASEFAGPQGSSVLKLFELDAAATGLTITAARNAGIDADAVILSPANHATYYPGAETMTLKVVFDREGGRVLGAQAIGRGGVDKRIDVIAVAIRARMTAADLTELDLAYAPPYSSAKDPVNMAGFMIQNILEGIVDQVTWDEALRLAAEDDGVALLDTRTAGENARGGIEGASHIPVDELRGRLDELPRDKRLLVFCASGLRSYVACRILSQHGFTCANIAGGYGFHAQVERGRAMPHSCVGDCGLPA